MSLTKETLYRNPYNDLGYSTVQSARLIESVLEIIKKAVQSGEDVLITGFGKFSLKYKKQRRGRNPATGDTLLLDARRIVTFKCSGVLRKKVG